MTARLKMTKTHRRSFAFTEEQAEALENTASLLGISMNDLVRQAVVMFCDHQVEKLKEPQVRNPAAPKIYSNEEAEVLRERNERPLHVVGEGEVGSSLTATYPWETRK